MLDIAATGRPQYPGPVRHKPGDRIAIQVVPGSSFDKVLYGGITGEVWMEPGVDEANVQATQARGVPVADYARGCVARSGRRERRLARTA